MVMGSALMMTDAQASVQAAGLGRLLYVDARAFGAKLDGVHDDLAALTSAAAVAQALKAPLWIGPGVAGLSSHLSVAGSLRIIGAGRDWTTLRLLSGSGVAVISSTGPLAGFELADLTIDGNWLGMGVALTSGGHDRVRICSCAIKNCVYAAAAGIGWPLAIGSASGAQSTNVQISDCLVGPNEPWNESVILINTDTAVIHGNIIRDALFPTHSTPPSNGMTGLAIWAYCRNVAVVGNTIENCWHEDVYFQESDNIVYVGNTHIRANNAGGGLTIMNCSAVTVGPNTWSDPYGLSTALSCFDVGGPSFNGAFPHLHTSSFDITYEKAVWNGFAAGVLYFQPPAPAGAANSPTTNLSTQHDVTFDGCILDNLAGGAPIQIGNGLQLSMARFTIRNCQLNGGSYGGKGGIVCIGNPGFANTTVSQVGGITGLPYGTAQSVTLAAIPAGLATGQYIHLHDGVNADYEVEITAINGVVVTGYFTGNMNNGAVVSPSTLLVNNGISDLLLQNNTIQAASSGGSSGVYLDGGVTRVRLIHNDLHNAAAGGGVAVKLLGGSGYQYAHGNMGYNPVAGAVATPAFPTAGNGVTNNTGVDVTAYVVTNGATGIGATVSDANNANPVTVGGFTVVEIPAGATYKVGGGMSGGPPTWTWYGN